MLITLCRIIIHTEIAYQLLKIVKRKVWFMVFNATLNNISVILWRSVLLEEDSGDNNRPVESH